MKFNRSSVAIGVAALTMSLLVSVPARAADSSITVGDSVCDFAAAGYGLGSATDPFTIATAKALAEIKDCSPSGSPHRSKAISGAAGNGTTVTFAVAADGGAYGVGQAVNISGMDPAGYDNSNARVISATATSVTVAGTEDETYVSGGSIESIHDYYKITANISLATGATDWNDTRSAAITAVSDDVGTTVTYTAANTFTAGDTVVIKGVTNNDYNLGTVEIASANSSSFTVSNGTSSAASLGGTASAQGWSRFDASELDIDGQNYTISGLTIDNSGDSVGFFGQLNNSNISNLNFTGASVDQTDRDRNSDYAGVLAGRMSASTTDNVTISGEVISGRSYAGLLTGYSDRGNHTNVTTSGSVSTGRILVSSNRDDRMVNYGGVIGESTQDATVDIHSSATVSGMVTSADNVYTVYGENIGGLIGYSNYSQMRDSSASGDVTGNSRVGGAIGGDSCCSDTSNSSASGNVSAFSNDGGRNASYVGGFYGLEGCCSGRDNISASGNVYVESTPTGGDIYGVGGLMGYYDCCGSISNSRATGDVTIVQNNVTDSRSVEDVGGFIGQWNCCGEISDSYSTGNVTVTSGKGNVYSVGGFIGDWDQDGVLRNTYATGNVSVTTADGFIARDLGGFIGYCDGLGSSIGSYATGDVTANNAYNVGGFVGHSSRYNMSYVDSYATGDVTTSYDGDGFVGGFIGKADQRMELTRVFASGNVSATESSAVGGLIGGTTGSDANIQFADSYYKGTVSGLTEVGGLIGRQTRYMSYNAKRTYVAATVVATGTNAVSDPVSKGRWVDGTRTDFVDSTLAGTTTNDPGFIAKTTAQMKTASTFTAAKWTFGGLTSPWRISSAVNGGYPYLVAVAKAKDPVATVAKYTKIKSVKYVRGATKLTKLQKTQLNAVAATIAAGGTSKVVLRLYATASQANSTALLARSASTYLNKRLDKLGSSASIRLEIRVVKKAKPSRIGIFSK